MKIIDLKTKNEMDLPPDTSTVDVPKGMDLSNKGAGYDAKKGTLHFYDSQGMLVYAWIPRIPLGERIGGEECLIIGEADQRDSDGRQFYWLSIVLEGLPVGLEKLWKQRL